MATHNKITNHQKPDLFNGTKTYFDTKNGKYKTEKLNVFEHLEAMQDQFSMPLCLPSTTGTPF